MTRWTARGIAGVLILVGAGVVDSARAQDSARLNRFGAGALTVDDFGVARPVVDGHLRVGGQLHLDYAKDPLVWERTQGDSDTEQFSIVGHQLDATFALNLSLFDRLALFAGLPVTLTMDGADESQLQSAGVGARDGAGLGDLSLGARLRIWGEADDVFAIGVSVSALFPTAGDQRFRGDAGFGFRPQLGLEFRPLGARIVLDLGALVRQDAIDEATNLLFRDELTFGVGVAVPVWRAADASETWLELHAQGYGATAFDDFLGRSSTPFEVIGGLKLFHQSGFVAGAAAGAGLTRGLGTPDLRAIAMLGFHVGGSPSVDEEEVEDLTDSDDDGVIDSRDQCPSEREDLDGFQDEDGCADPDNDNDGVHDEHDRCPLEAETPNSFEDSDGCPDEVGDADGDGLLDHVDRCPSEPEDRDDWRDEDGCPDPDNDGDGVVDAFDRCVEEYGPTENRGCPDTDRDIDGVYDRLDNCPDVAGDPRFRGCLRPQRVVLAADRVQILDRVFFHDNSARVQGRSHSLLRNVANVLRAHPEIELVVIEGHTDDRGDHDRNVALSRRRAGSVLDFLVSRGVEASRLRARGYGPDRPAVEGASTDAERGENRRVEFVIPGPGEEVADDVEAGPDAEPSVDGPVAAD